MTLFNNFCAAILAVASACRTAINDAVRIIFGFFAAEANAAVGFLPTIRRMKSATAFLAVAVAIPLMSACGGGGSSGGTDLNSPRGPGTTERDSSVGTISQATVMSVVMQVRAAEQDTDPTPIPQPMASDGASLDDENSVFPVGSAFIRSANGNDYAFIYQQDFSITTTINVPEVLPSFDLADASSFTYQVSSGGCTGGDGVPSSLASCEPDADDSNMGTWTFTGPGSIPATTTFSGVAFSVFVVASLSPTPTSETIVTVTAMAATMTMSVSTFSPIHVWEFETGQTNSEVASVVAAFQTKVTAAAESDLVEAVVTVTVKGARDRVNRSRESDNQNIRYSVDAYIFETQYSALGLWIEDPREFFGLSTVAWDSTVSESGVFYFGLQTPAAGVPDTGTATYSGIAAGRYFRNRGVSADDRFSVSGVVNLEANFVDAGGISGTAALTAYGVTDLATSEGEVTVQLSEPLTPNPASNIDGATFFGATSISPGSSAGAFRALERGVGGTGGFVGYFTGPGGVDGAEEAVGSATFESGFESGRDGADGAHSLEFGFLTRQAPPPDDGN